MSFDAEHLAAMKWTYIAEADDQAARGLIAQVGYERAFAAVCECQAEVDGRAMERWKARLERMSAVSPARLQALQISIVLPTDAQWPSQLNDLGDSIPLALWVRGDPAVLQSGAIALVGSRTTSEAGRRHALDFAYELSSDHVVVSGGAFGIDAQAHLGALAAGGSTVVVSAGGVNRAYPPSHANLFESVIAAGGAVISESPWGAAPQRYRFLLRNRIIAALSGVTLVVQAGYRSGAINTAHHALELGREVAALPGDVDDPLMTGCNQLLRSGAHLVTTASEVRELAHPYLLSRSALEVDVSPPRLDATSERVLDAVPLKRYVSAAQIATLASLSLAEVLAKLSKLEVEGRVETRDGQWKKKV